mmetsp:Transcript_5597/g.13608  ORF Transcript_5597/g.13608 Transcript_5597/m.13608 type:complete len:180 (+) Transcript_5597:203-742(+)
MPKVPRLGTSVQSGDLNVVVSSAPLESVTIAATASSADVVIEPSSLTFTPTSVALPWRITVATAGAYTISYTVSGVSSFNYTTPESTVITVIPAKTITLPAYPATVWHEVSLLTSCHPSPRLAKASPCSQRTQLGVWRTRAASTRVRAKGEVSCDLFRRDPGVAPRWHDADQSGSMACT